MSTATDPKIATATLVGHVEYIAKKDDGSTEVVKIQQLKIKQYPELVAVLGDEPAMAEFLCGKPAGWSDSLTNESLFEIVAEGEKVNQDFFLQWVPRRRARFEKIATPELKEKLVTAALDRSATTLRNSPSNAASPIRPR